MELEALRTLPSLDVDEVDDGIERAMRAARLLTGRANMASPISERAGDRSEAKEKPANVTLFDFYHIFGKIYPHFMDVDYYVYTTDMKLLHQ